MLSSAVWVFEVFKSIVDCFLSCWNMQNKQDECFYILDDAWIKKRLSISIRDS